VRHVQRPACAGSTLPSRLTVYRHGCAQACDCRERRTLKRPNLMPLCRDRTLARNRMVYLFRCVNMQSVWAMHPWLQSAGLVSPLSVKAATGGSVVLVQFLRIRHGHRYLLNPGVLVLTALAVR
jgi:hypothetical protein